MLVSDLFLSDDDELKNWSHIIKTEMKCMFCSQWGETRLKCFELLSTKTMKDKNEDVTETKKHFRLKMKTNSNIPAKVNTVLNYLTGGRGCNDSGP